jgi:acyl-[acyl-carrier-protein]-phospholipid O-acyltransferase/long-chain-fatty-acid--[acyl-carrier-protein] ligase
VYNGEVLRTPGPVLLLPNHVSWWDWALIGVCLEEDWRFVTSSVAAERNWILRSVMKSRRTFPLDISSPYAVKHVAEYLMKGGRLVLFPEGRISTTGSLMKLFDGTGFLIQKTRARVITAYLRGASRLPWSPNGERKQWFPRVSVHFSEVQEAGRLEHVSARSDREHQTNWLRSRMIRQQFDVEMELGARTLPEAITRTARQWPSLLVMEDVSMRRVTYRQLLLGASLLAREWRKMPAESHRRVGVLLPNACATPVVLLSLWSVNRIPAVLNYSSGIATVLSCARLAGLKEIITSRRLLEHLKFDAGAFKAAGIELVFVEDVRRRVPAWRQIAGALRHRLFPLPGNGFRGSAEDTAVVLFTSGSEGEPKGVELTHRNLLANMRQMLAVVDIKDTDRFFVALPLFHSFGLTIGALLPLVRGIYAYFYPSPLHYRVVPSALYHQDCTIFFATNSFLAGYARKAHPYDFRSVRYLYAGAEKLQEATANTWMRKFGVRVIEGYGATECSPCISANAPMRPRFGTAGEFLPAIEHRLEKVEGISDAAERNSAEHPHVNPSGRLYVRGPNVMRGYLNPEANAQFRALGGWYDTGDIAEVDADGFVRILGRLKRFAKISGEMVSLTAVEEALAGAFPEYGPKFAVAVIARPDPAKGEKLMAVANEPRLTLEQIREALRARGFGNLAAPREIRILRELPRLGTGKVNYRELEGTEWR